MTKQDHQRLPIFRMEGAMARWYARQRGSASQLVQYRESAVRLTRDLPDGAAILEIAPGPGHHAVELARLGRFTVTGLDISRSFVRIAAEYARGEGVSVDFRQGDAAELPFPDASFDLVVCQAAFKNFTRPVRALDEMFRVLRGGGVAVIEDMNREASTSDIAEEVRRTGAGPRNAFLIRTSLRALRHRAFAPGRFRRLAAESAFRDCRITTAGIGLEVRLTRP